MSSLREKDIRRWPPLLLAYRATFSGRQHYNECTAVDRNSCFNQSDSATIGAVPYDRCFSCQHNYFFTSDLDIIHKVYMVKNVGKRERMQMRYSNQKGESVDDAMHENPTKSRSGHRGWLGLIKQYDVLRDFRGPPRIRTIIWRVTG